MPLEETETVTNITAEINTNTIPAIDYTASLNAFILDHHRSTAQDDYTDLDNHGFAEKAKTQDILPKHGIKTPKIYQEAIPGPQPKESWQTARQKKANSQFKRKTSRITRPFQEDKFTPIFRPDNTHILPSLVPVTKNWKMRRKRYDRQWPYKTARPHSFRKVCGITRIDERRQRDSEIKRTECSKEIVYLKGFRTGRRSAAWQQHV